MAEAERGQAMVGYGRGREGASLASYAGMMGITTNSRTTSSSQTAGLSVLGQRPQNS